MLQNIHHILQLCHGGIAGELRTERPGQRSHPLCLSPRAAVLPSPVGRGHCLSDCSVNQITRMIGVKRNPEK